MPTPGFLPIDKPARRPRRSNADRRAADADLAIPKGCIRVADDAVLVWARTLGICEWCGRPGPTDPSHSRSRGAGGPDRHANVTSLCRRCHDLHHDGHEPTTEQLLATAARRERLGRARAAALAAACPAAWVLSTPPTPPRP